LSGSLVTPVRRLPVTLAPVTRETLSSYINRLATVNYIDSNELADTVAIGRSSGPRVIAKRFFNAENFAAVTGHSTKTLTRALPELAQPQHRFFAHREIQACPGCSRRHRGGTVLIHPVPQQHVCVRHSIWLGTLGPDSSSWIQNPGARSTSAPFRRSALPSGATTVSSAATAPRPRSRPSARPTDTWERSNSSDGLGMTQWERIRVLRPGATSISQHDPVASAVCYPEIVMMAGVLASPYWQAVATEPFADRTAYTEINRRLRDSGERFGNVWPTKRHPLTYWADGLRLEKQRRERAAEGSPHLPQTPSAHAGNSAGL
jgi:hypothetical protein